VACRSFGVFSESGSFRPFPVQLGDGELDREPVGSNLTNNPLVDGRLLAQCKGGGKLSTGETP